MNPRSSTWNGTIRGLALLVMLATCGLRGVAGAPPAKTDWPSLPKDVVLAWKKAGAEVGWVGVNQSGFLVFLPVEVRGPEEKSVIDVLPAFEFRRWQTDVAKLPAPPTAFGLYLSDT